MARLDPLAQNGSRVAPGPDAPCSVSPWHVNAMTTSISPQILSRTPLAALLVMLAIGVPAHAQGGESWCAPERPRTIQPGHTGERIIIIAERPETGTIRIHVQGDISAPAVGEAEPRLAPGAHLMVREHRTGSASPCLELIAAADGRVRRAFYLGRRPAPYDASAQGWFAHLLPIVQSGGITEPGRRTRAPEQ